MTATQSNDLQRRVSRSLLRRRAICLVAAFLAAGGTGRAAEPSPAASRLTVAILTFEDQTADPEAAHWRYTIPVRGAHWSRAAAYADAPRRPA